MCSVVAGIGVISAKIEVCNCKKCNLVSIKQV